jgi:hypothetical protein
LLDEVGSSAPLFCEKEEEQMARSRQAYPLAVALMVGVVLSLSVFLLVFFGIFVERYRQQTRRGKP